MRNGLGAALIVKAIQGRDRQKLSSYTPRMTLTLQLTGTHHELMRSPPLPRLLPAPSTVREEDQ